MVSFIPTFLYIKQHTKTKKLYFGKTVKNPNKYNGSGSYWTKHINKHGVSDIETLWYCLYLDEETIKEFALMCSNMWRIVENIEWANLMTESGSGDYFKSEETLKNQGASKVGNSYFRGRTHTVESKEKNRKAHLGKKLTASHKIKIGLGVKGRVKTKDEIKRISETLIGVSHPEERIKKMRQAKLDLNLKWYSSENETLLFPENTAPLGWVPGRKKLKLIEK